MHSSPTPLATGLDPAERIRQLEAENRQLRQELSASRTPAEGEKREARQEMGLRSILDHVPAMVGYWDRDLRNRFSNQAYQAWFGIDPAAIMGRHIQEIIGEERYRLNLPYIKGVLRGEAQQFERAIPRPDGKGIRHSLANYIPDIIAGEVQGFYVLVTETTALHDAHEALRASEERYRDVIEDQTELISRLAADGSFIFANQVFCRFFGKTREDLLGQTWAPGCYPEDRPLVEAALSSLSAENPTVVVENRIYSGNGQVYWMQFINRGFFDTSGRLLEIQSVGRDITDRRQAQEALQEAHAQMERRVIERTEQLRRLTIEKALTEERERQSIARDLHDGLGQLLHVAKIKLDGLAKNLPASGRPARRRQPHGPLADLATESAGTGQAGLATCPALAGRRNVSPLRPQRHRQLRCQLPAAGTGPGQHPFSFGPRTADQCRKTRRHRAGPAGYGMPRWATDPDGCRHWPRHRQYRRDAKHDARLRPEQPARTPDLPGGRMRNHQQGRLRSARQPTHALAAVVSP